MVERRVHRTTRDDDEAVPRQKTTGGISQRDKSIAKWPKTEKRHLLISVADPVFLERGDFGNQARNWGSGLAGECYAFTN